MEVGETDSETSCSFYFFFFLFSMEFSRAYKNACFVSLLDLVFKLTHQVYKLQLINYLQFNN